MKKRPVSLSAVLLAVLCLYNIAHATETLDITRPWVREAPPSARVLAAYMSIKNTGKSTITIVGISSTEFESAELHRTVIHEGVASMQHIKQLDVPANGSIKLEPGGLHLMLFNPQHTLSAGDSVTLTIHLSNDICMTVTAPVVRQTFDDNSQHDHSQHHH
jgi:copper(I)-binding protein